VSGVIDTILGLPPGLVLALVFLLPGAGHETTVTMISNGVRALLVPPEQLALLRDQPHRLPDAIEEMLRFDGPLQVAPFRWTAEPVDIVYAYEGADARLLDAARPGAPGVVVAAFGRGNMPLAMYDGVSRWLAEGKPAVITSRAARGRVAPTYGFPGGGRSLADAGAILAGARRPQQARIDVMLAVCAGRSVAQIRELLESV